MRGVEEEQVEEALLQSALARLKAARDAAQARLKVDETGSDAKADSKAGAGSAAGKGSTGTTEAEDEEQEQQSSKKADKKQQEKYSKQIMQDPAVQAAVAAVEEARAQRRNRQFPVLVSAYLAAAAVSRLQQTGAVSCLF
jgi:hypothetical protein